MSANTEEHQIESPWGPPEPATPEEAFEAKLLGGADEETTPSDEVPNEDGLFDYEVETLGADEVPEDPDEEPEAQVAEGLDGEQPPEGLGTKAQERFRELANGKKAAEAKASELERMLAQLLRQQQAQLQHQQQSQEWARQQAQQTQRQQLTVQEMQRLKEIGFDEADFAHQMSLSAVRKTTAVEQRFNQKIEALERKIQEYEYAAQQSAWDNALDSELNAVLAGREITPELRAELRETAHLRAVHNPQLDARSAVATLQRLVSSLPAKSRKPGQRVTPEERELVSHAAKRGGTGGKTSSRSKNPISPEAPEDGLLWMFGIEPGS